MGEYGLTKLGAELRIFSQTATLKENQKIQEQGENQSFQSLSIKTGITSAINELNWS